MISLVSILDAKLDIFYHEIQTIELLWIKIISKITKAKLEISGIKVFSRDFLMNLAITR